MFPPLLSLRRVRVPAVLGLVSLASAADSELSSSSSNPRYTGAPFARTWLADDYGAGPQNYCVLQHPRTGLIYVGNANGVLEFDGVRWRLIPAPGEGRVASLCVDGRGRVWGCGTAAVFRLEPDARGELRARSMLERLPAEFRALRLGAEVVANSQGVYFRDSKNLMFFGDDDGPAQGWHLAEGTAVLLRLFRIGDDPYVTIGAPVNVIVRRRGGEFERTQLDRSVLASRAEPDGTWRLLTPLLIERWNGRDRPATERSLGADEARAASYLPDGRCVLGTLNSGLLLCDREGRTLAKIDRTRGLPANQVVGVAVDREGGVWAASPYGIARVQLDSPYARHGPAQGVDGTTNSLVRHGDVLFVGGTEGVVARQPDGRFRRVEGIMGPERALVAHGEWLFALSGQLQGMQPASGREVRELENRNYFGFLPLAGAPGWFAHGSNSGLRWAHFAGDAWISEGPLKKISRVSTALLEAPAGIVWVNAGGLWRVDFRAGLRADAPAHRFTAAEGIRGEASALFLLGGEVVAAAQGKLVRYDEAARRFRPETRIAGLEGFAVEAAQADADGTVWLQGAAPAREIRRVVPDGVARWRVETLPGEPLRHVLPTTLYHEAATRTLWIGGHGALISRDLTWQPARPAAPPVAVVRRLETAAGELLAAGDGAAPGPRLAPLEPEQSALRISFAAPTFASDHTGAVDTEYRTRLDGLERGWSAWSRQTARDFTNLPWRAFTFRVQARDDAGRVGPEATLAFSIRPAWWATRWAWTGYAALGLLGLAGTVRLRTQALRRRAERLELVVAERTRELAHSNEQLGRSNAQLAAGNAELARLHRLELDEKIAAQLSEEKARLEVLRYQLNPHFLYNSLNSIYGLLFENARDAGEMVLRLSEFCRATLTGPQDELPTLGAEIGALRSYVEVEKVRWGEKLQIEFDVAPDVESVRLPPFLLLPLVENAIKYGSRTSPDVLRLRISARSAGRAVLIEIANTGQWLERDPARPDSSGIGLENLRQRLRRYYPGAHEFTLEARDGWVTARLRIAHAESSAAPVNGALAGNRQS